MFGKIFESLYEGSMYGKGIAVFAVWGYVISKARAGRVELNPKKLADTLGGKIEEVEKAITFLCSPDPDSRNKDHGGCRMIKEGEYQYWIPNHAHYRNIRDEEARREYNRLAKQKSRLALKAKHGGTLQERRQVAECEAGIRPAERLGEIATPVSEAQSAVVVPSPGVEHA